MNNLFIAYNIKELEKQEVVSKSRSLYKSGLISPNQWDTIKDVYASGLYTPSVFIRLLLFILSYIGLSTAAIPFALMFSHLDRIGYQILFVSVGVLLLFLTEKILIKERKHYQSGVTEAGLYAGISFIALGILIYEPKHIIIYPVVLFILTAAAAIRYLNHTSLILSIGFMGWILFQALTDIGGYAKAIIPFVFMAYFGGIYMGTVKLEKILPHFILNEFYLILKSIGLLCFYISGNYFVVHELSINLMELQLAEGENIPFAFLFYAFTVLIPLGYMYWGIKKKSILFIRTGLIITALTVITFKYYFSIGAPVVTITLAGALLTIISLLLFNYLKKSRNGFTRELILKKESHSKDLTAFVASQTLGGNNTQTNDTNSFGGGEFGGGGASSDW